MSIRRAVSTQSGRAQAIEVVWLVTTLHQSWLTPTSRV